MGMSLHLFRSLIFVTNVSEFSVYKSYTFVKFTPKLFYSIFVPLWMESFPKFHFQIAQSVYKIGIDFYKLILYPGAWLIPFIISSSFSFFLVDSLGFSMSHTGDIFCTHVFVE